MENIDKILEKLYQSDEFRNWGESMKEGCPDLQKMDRYMEVSSTLTLRQLTTPFTC